MQQKKQALKVEKEQLVAQMTEPANSSLPYQKVTKTAAIASLQDQLDGPSKVYERYLTAFVVWEQGRTAIQGDVDTSGSVACLIGMIADLDTLPERLATLLFQRRGKSLEIFAQIEAEANVYREVYKPVQDFSNEHPLINEQFKLNFSVSIVRKAGMSEKFFAFIGQKVAGSFCGTEEGEKVFGELVDKHDCSSAEGAIAFANDLLGHLTHDQRGKDPIPIPIGKQLRKQQKITELYDYIYSFGYLAPEYNLNLGQKMLSQLSHGERGMLLLMFYLLIDKENIPLVIDQPEGHLDNQTVYILLGECIKEAKKRRQIIIVTHNPNLAVACDAEQIICAQMDQVSGNKVTYTAGAIEDENINQMLLDILEGTRPAFNNRDEKYYTAKA